MLVVAVLAACLLALVWWLLPPLNTEQGTSAAAVDGVEQDILRLNSGFPAAADEALGEEEYKDDWIRFRHYGIVIDAGR